MSQVGRFFRPKMLLAPVAFLVVALLVTLYVVYSFFVLNVIHIGGGLFALLFAVLGFGTVVLAFPHGCKRCGVVLERRVGIYAPEHYEALSNLISAPDPAGIAHFAPQRTMSVLHHRAMVQIEACPQCARVLVAQVADERWEESFYAAKRCTADVEHTDEAAAALLALVG